MTNRSAIVLDAISGVTGLVEADISAAEIQLANTKGLLLWPAIASYGVHGANEGFVDRINEETVYTDTTGAGWAIDTWGPNFAEIYRVSSLATVFRTGTLPALSAGFTIGAVFSNRNLGISGNTTNVAASWWLNCDANGKPYFKVGTFRSDPASWTGPVIESDTTLRSVVWRYNPVAGSVTLRINDHQQTWTDSGLLAKTPHPQMQFGLTYTAADAATTPTAALKSGPWGACIAYGLPLSDPELLVVESMLQQYV